MLFLFRQRTWIRVFACICLAALLSGLALSQSAETVPVFEIADVHVSPHGTNQYMRGGVMRGGRYELRTASMLDLIGSAYGVDADKVIGGPSWLDTDRFDVIAKAPPNTSPEAMILMLRALLKDRFKLVVHEDRRPMPVYALTVGKRPQLKEADGSGDTGCEPQMQPVVPGAIRYQTYACHNVTMAAFADRMGGMAPAYVDKPVIDMTSLKGSWNFTIKWTGRGLLTSAGEGISFFDAVDKQLGLKLEPQKVSMPVIVVDSVNQKPTDNLPGVSQSLPELPTEFEVVDIKPSDPNAPQRGGRRFQPGGRIEMRGTTVKSLITMAWNISSDDLLAGAPKWLDTDRFDVIAKAPANEALSTPPSSGRQAGTIIDLGSLRPMVQAMLKDRFRLTTHMEDRPVTVYALTVKKSKLKPADPSSRAGCKTTVTPPGTAGSSGPTFTYTCQNTTMAKLAEDLSDISIGEISHPVIDSTGLAGAWDFVLSWSPLISARLGGGGRNGDAGRIPATAQPLAVAPADAPAAADPNSGLTMLEAIEKLGLKLELQKHSMPVLVIDHVEQKPTEN